MLSRSKFVFKYVCLQELYLLFKVVIASSIKKGTVEHFHRNGSYVTHYKAELPLAVGKFIHPEEGRLFQFGCRVMFIDGAFYNAWPYGKGYTVTKRKKGVKYDSWAYSSTTEHKGKPGTAEAGPSKKKKSRGARSMHTSIPLYFFGDRADYHFENDQ